MEYEVGKQYTLNVAGIRVDSAETQYMSVYDDSSDREYRVYNILKCQYENLPTKVHVVAMSVDVFGKVRFRQDEAWLNKEHYKVGKMYAFEVTDVKEDHNSKTPYYVIEDDFSLHRYYFQGEQKYQIGESCILGVEGFTSKGFLKLKEVRHSGQDSSKTAHVRTANDHKHVKDNKYLLGVGSEGHTVEFKNSIAFPPDRDGDADIDKQLYNVLKELMAFMNADGGTLYIGVHDRTKEVTGIECDYPYLNEGKDEFAGNYKEDRDGYELKIRNTIDSLCPSVANSLISVDFEYKNGRTLCKITVKSARRPIFLSGTQLYVRQGNRVKLLKGDEITFFVTSRMTLSIREVIDTDDLDINMGTIGIEEIKSIVRDLINERKSIPKNLPKPKNLGEVDYWIVWYNEGTWKRSRNELCDSNIYMQIPVYKNMSNPILAFCYETGRVNTVKLSDFRKGANLNTPQKNGWSRTGDKPKNIFLMLATDFLVGYSVDSNGIESVKLHAISDYGTTASAANQGAPFLPDTSRIETFAVIGAEHKKNIAHLIVTKAKRSVEVGTPLSSPTLKNEIEYLERILQA